MAVLFNMLLLSVPIVKSFEFKVARIETSEEQHYSEAARWCHRSRRTGIHMNPHLFLPTISSRLRVSDCVCSMLLLAWLRVLPDKDMFKGMQPVSR